MNSITLRKLRRTIEEKAARASHLETRVRDLAKREAELIEQADAIPPLAELLQQFNQFMQVRTFTFIESIVDRCLAAIFPEPFTFKLVAQVKRKQFEVTFEFWKDGESYDPLTEVEGGVLDIASFGLRLAFLTLKQTRRLLLMDEPFKWVSAANRPRLLAMLRAIARDLDFQIIIVTHLPELIDAEATVID